MYTNNERNVYEKMYRDDKGNVFKKCIGMTKETCLKNVFMTNKNMSVIMFSKSFTPN